MLKVFVLIAAVLLSLAPPSRVVAQASNSHLSQADVDRDFEEILSALTVEVTKNAKAHGVSDIAVTNFYYNGSSAHPAALYIKRKITGKMLDAGTGLSIAERDDITILLGENQLQLFANGESEGVAFTSDAILTGELLNDNQFGQGVLSVRLIDIKTTSIIAASISVINLGTDLTARLGNSRYIGSSRKPPLPISLLPVDGKFITRIKDVGPFALLPLTAIPSDRQFSARILYAHLVTALVRAGIPVLEREFIYYVAAEKAISNEAISKVIGATGLIQIAADETSILSSPTFFVKAIQRRGGELIAQEEVVMESDATHATVSSIGSDDSLEAAITAHRELGAIKAEALRFKEVFVLSDTMKLSQNKFRLTDSPHGKKVATFFGWNRSPGYGIRFGSHNRAYLDQPQFSGRAMFDWYLDELLSSEKGDVQAIKAALVSIASVGGEFEINNQTMHHIGPIHEIFTSVSRTLTTNSNQTPSPLVWYDCFADFSKRFYSGTNPRLADEDSLPGYQGSYKANIRGTEIKFNFTVDSIWRGKYPSQVQVEIDMFPMRDRLRLVTKP